MEGRAGKASLCLCAWWQGEGLGWAMKLEGGQTEQGLDVQASLRPSEQERLMVRSKAFGLRLRGGGTHWGQGPLTAQCAVGKASPCLQHRTGDTRNPGRKI